MKKVLLGLLIFTLSTSSLVGCTTKTSAPKEEEQQVDVVEKEEVKEDAKFVNENGILTYLDTEASPFDEVGVKVLIESGIDGHAKFIKTDLEGNEGVDYYIFDYKDNIFEKYSFVSAMNSGYYYYYDLENKELTKIEDKDHNDSTEKMKEANRWDSAVTNVEDDIQILEEYFVREHGKTIKEFVIE